MFPFLRIFASLETLRNNLEYGMGGLGHVMLYRYVDATW